MKKIKTILAALLLIIGVFPVSTFAADDAKTVTVRIEGKSETYFYGQVTTTAGNVADLMKEVSEKNDSVTVCMETGDYGSYITQINDDKAGTVEPAYYDGWSDMINGESPMVGIDAQEINDGDVIVFYYSDEFGSHGFARPVADTSKLSDGIIKFTTDGYDESYNPVTLPVEGATVTWDKTEYTTDKDGQITIAKAELTVGEHSVQISKTAEDGMPLVLRFADDYKITVEQAADTETGDINAGFYAVLMAAAITAIVLTGKKEAYEK